MVIGLDSLLATAPGTWHIDEGDNCKEVFDEDEEPRMK